MSKAICEIVGDGELEQYAFACCDLARGTVQAVGKGSYANCVVRAIWKDGRAEVWTGGIVSLIVDERKHRNYGKFPLPSGASIRCDENGHGIWANAFSERRDAVLLSVANHPGHVVYARLT